jgi:hypothetical protein
MREKRGNDDKGWGVWRDGWDMRVYNDLTHRYGRNGRVEASDM